MCYFITALLCYCVTQSLCLLCYCIIGLLYYCVISYCATALLCYSVTVFIYLCTYGNLVLIELSNCGWETDWLTNIPTYRLGPSKIFPTLFPPFLDLRPFLGIFWIFWGRNIIFSIFNIIFWKFIYTFGGVCFLWKIDTKAHFDTKPIVTFFWDTL